MKLELKHLTPINIIGFNEAIIGVEKKSNRIMYSVSKCLDVIEAKGLPFDDALEYFYKEIKPIRFTENKPIFCFDNLK